MTVEFFREDEKWGELSNFYPSPIRIDGIHYPTVEHYYQSQKFHHDAQYMEVIRTASTPNKAKILARQQVCLRGLAYTWQIDLDKIIRLHQKRGVVVRADWGNEVKEEVMYVGLMAKFTQHPRLAEMLISTGDRPLVETSPYDSYWGGKGRGQNRLGHLLQRVRTQLKCRPSDI